MSKKQDEKEKRRRVKKKIRDENKTRANKIRKAKLIKTNLHLLCSFKIL